MTNFVYNIKHNNIIIYIGRTNNIKRRQYQHRYNYSKMQSKKLYNYLRDNNCIKEDITLESIYEGSKVECKRMEMYLILDYHFNKDPNQLQQKIPNIKDGWK